MNGRLKRLIENITSREGSYLKRITAIIVLFSLTIVIAVTAALFIGTNDVVRKEIYNVNIGILSQLQMYVDMYVADSINATVKDNFVDISGNKELKDFFETSDCPMGSYYTLTKYISDIKGSNTYMDSIYLYSVKNDAAVSSQEGLIKNAMMSGYNNISKIQEKVKNTKERSFWITPSENGNGMITYVQLIPMMDYEKRNGFVAININAENVVKTVSGNFMKSGDIAVLSPDGSLLAHSDKDRLSRGSTGIGFDDEIFIRSSGTVTRKIDSEEYDVIWLKSSSSGLGYMLLFPEQAYNGRIRVLQIYCLVIMAGMLLITFISAKYLSAWVTSPIRQNTAFLEEKLVYDIVHENSVGEADIASRLKILNTSFCYPRFYLVIFEVSLLSFYDCGLDERKSINEKAIRVIKNSFLKDANVVCANEGLSQITAVINTDMDSGRVYDICHYILTRLKIECDISFNCSISGVVDKARYIGSMYDNVRKALEYGYIFGYDRVFTGEEFKKWESGFGSISVKTQKDLEGMLRSGNIKGFTDETEKLIGSIKSGQSSITTAKGMLLEIVSVIFRVGSDKKLFGENEEFSYLDKIKSIDEYSIWINLLLENFKENKTDKETNGQRHFIDRVSAYIAENISNDISLNSVAEAMNISPNYLSRIFKEEMGESFSGFVQDKKLEYAENLLVTTKFSVSEISKLSGYSNEAYFSKLFKSKYSTTPGQYRKINKK